MPRRVLVIPLLWAAMGSTAALLLAVREDFGLAVAGLIVVSVLLGEKRGDRSRLATARGLPSAADVLP